MPSRFVVLLLLSSSMALAAAPSRAAQSGAGSQPQAQPTNMKDQIIMGACSQAMASELSTAGKTPRRAWSRRPADVW
jgi:hypothetical protein